MQLIRYEIRKLTSKRNLIVAILLLLFATFTFLYMEQLQSNDVMAKYKDVYFSINKQLNGKNLQDKKAWIENVRIYLTGYNLFCFTKYSGADPEVDTSSKKNAMCPGVDYAAYPKSRSFVGGINVTF